MMILVRTKRRQAKIRQKSDAFLARRRDYIRNTKPVKAEMNALGTALTGSAFADDWQLGGGKNISLCCSSKRYIIEAVVSHHANSHGVSFMEFVSAKEKSEEWGISLRRVQKFCEQGRVHGVQRLGKIWLIPKEAERPADLRYSANKQD